MAVLKAPLLSIDARGKFANAIVYSGWKGLKTARQHVVPANPQTTDQTTQRGFMTDAVSAWKNYFTNEIGRTAWNRWALNDSRPMSGFNAFTSNAIARMIDGAPDNSYANVCAANAVQTLLFTMLNLDDGAAGDEGGNFEIWVGSTVSGMTLSETVAIAGGTITSTVDLGDADDVVYCKLRKHAVDRSGIFKITLI